MNEKEVVAGVAADHHLLSADADIRGGIQDQDRDHGHDPIQDPDHVLDPTHHHQGQGTIGTE